MSLTWNSRIIANAHLTRVHGFKVAGGYGLRLGVDFTVPNWEVEKDGPIPAVFFASSVVEVGDSQPLAIGRAFPETPQPFRVSKHSSGPTGALFDVILTPAAMERVERQRAGRDLRVTVKLQAEARKPEETLVVAYDASKTFTQSDWLVALEQAGFGRSMLFEVPIPEGAEGDEDWTRTLERARHDFFLGRYPSAVTACRMVLESLTQGLKQEAQLKVARDLHKKDRQLLSVDQRELILRQAAMDYSSLSVHMGCGHPDDLFDRGAAQMLLSITSSLVSSALTRAAEAQLAVKSAP